MEWMLMPLRRYADFQGRSRRKEYWMFVLGYTIVSAIMVGLMFGTGGFNGENFDFNIVSGIVVAVFGLFVLALLIPSIAVQVRRLHDQNISGWWLLGIYIASAIPVVGFIASVALLVFMCLPGKRGPNRFGPDPKEDVAAAFV